MTSCLGFPDNILDEIETSLIFYLDEYSIVRRPLRVLDAVQSLGLFVVDWQPDQSSIQIGNQREPAMNRYNLRIQLLVKHNDEVEARGLFGLGCKTIREMLYRDSDLLIRLTALTENILGTIERVRRIGVQRQRFLNNDIRGSFLFLATTEMWIDTESVKQ